jgi:GT2 family glycosyltransferase
MSDGRVTVVYVPRERFSPTRRTLEAFFEHTPEPYELVVVDGGSPRELASWLREQSMERGFKLIRTEHLLTPNQARNLGMEHVDTELVALLDNDVVVDEGWLERMIECLDETGASIVAPLTCEGEPLGERVHFAGGEVAIIEEEEDGRTVRRVRDKMYLAQRKTENVRDELVRKQIQLAEFHAILVRTELLRKIGPFDEEMITRDHLDFCLEVAQNDGTIWFEPESVVHYVPGPAENRHDVLFYMLRWSDAWEKSSLEHFRQKWQLEDDEFFRQRLSRLGWRRQMTLIDPFCRRIFPGKLSGAASRALRPPEHVLNRVLVRRHTRARGRSAA